VTRPPFPAVLDSTLVSTFRSCPHKFFLNYVMHWKPRNESVHLVAGAAFAKGLEIARRAFFSGEAERPVFEDRMSDEGIPVRVLRWEHIKCEPGDGELATGLGLQALLASYGDYDCPPDSAKSAERMAAALAYYMDEYPLNTEHAPPSTLSDGRRGIEFSFAEPLEIIHPETGDPLLYCGRMDQIVDFAGAVFGEDDKTTSSLGASWSNQWDLRSQFTGYTWACQQSGIPLQGFLVRGIGILKTKFDTQQAITYRPQWQLERWHKQLLRDAKRMIQCWEEGYWDYNLDHACTEYGGCIFRKVCLSSDPQPWLEADFVRRVWNPLTRVEEEVK
jgi:hypothetical protein